MRYHYEKPLACNPIFGETYICDHPVYSRCTLYKIGDEGLAVIQQRWNPETKCTYWTEIDDYLRNPIFLNPGFLDYFKISANKMENGIYPTVTIRKLMWVLRMKPLKKERWETVFDRRLI